MNEGQRIAQAFIVTGVVMTTLVVVFFTPLPGIFWRWCKEGWEDQKRQALAKREAHLMSRAVDHEGGEESEEDAPVSPTLETETKPVPSFSHAGKQDGNAVSVSPSLPEAVAYAEMILVDRLADLVMAEKLDKSIAIKVGMRAPTGRAYQAAKEKLETVMRAKEYPTLTKDGRPISRSLRTSAK